MGCGCGSSKKANTSTMARRAQARQSEALLLQQRAEGVTIRVVPFDQLTREEQENMSNKEFVLIEYMHRNRGMHHVYGATGNKRNYGYRKSGDRFLIHIDDARRQPDIFRVVVSERAKIQEMPDLNLDQPTPPPPPPPLPVRADEDSVSVPPPELVLDYDIATEELLEATGEIELIDVSTLPGVSPAVERQLKAEGVVTYDKFIELGVDGLVKIKYIGATKAQLIIEFVEEHYGTNESGDQ